MNRVIKFRAWDKKFNKWIVEGFHIFGETTLFDTIGSHCFETKGEGDSLDRYVDIEVSQFTGLKDVNGKDIYEGDIVKHFEGEGRGFVKYTCCSFLVEWVGLDCYSDLLGWYNFKRGIASEPKDYEVVGNIYENPTFS